MKNFLVLSLVAFSSAIAEYELHYPDMKMTGQKEINRPPEPVNSISQNKVIITSVNGMIIAPESDRPGSYVIKTTKGVQNYRTMQGISIKKREALLKELDQFVLGKPLTLKKIGEIKAKISQFYQDNGHSLVIVNIPEQDVSDGVVVVTVLESKLGKVEVIGNKWFTSERYLQNLSLEEDQTIDTGALDADIVYINESPWRRVSAVYKPGAQYGTTDIDLYVQDERPARLFVGADNTGFKVTGYNRLFVGFNWGHFLNYDHQLAFQYTASPDFHKFQAVTVYYSAPLPWRDEIDLFGGYSYVNVDRSSYIPTSNNKGSDWQASARYGIFIPPSGNFFQKAKFGLDVKQTNNDLTVANINYIANSFASVAQLAGIYEASYKFGRNNFDFLGEGYVQPWDFGSTMSKKNYKALRPNAVNKYLYIRMKGDYVWSDPKSGMMVTIKGRVQFSSGALIPLESFGLGGENSVRGYVERVVNVDNGGILNLEFRTPFVSPSRNRINDRLAGIIFLDLGAGGILKSLSNQPSSYFLAGIGPGIRYDISSNLRARFDVGFRLTDAPFASSSKAEPQLYFGVIGSF